MRIGDDARARVDEADPRARLKRGTREHLLLARRAELDAGGKLGFDERLDDGRLVRHVALERIEQLPLVETREFAPRRGNEHDEEVHGEEPVADASGGVNEAFGPAPKRPGHRRRHRGVLSAAR